MKDDSLRQADAGPTVGVVIPTRNRSGYLRLAIESVLAQSRPADEVVVVDDGSTDDTPAVVASYPAVRYLRREQGGPSRARNAGLAALGTTHVWFLDDDDLLVPEAITAHLETLARHPEADVLYGRFRRIDGDGRVIGEEMASYRPPRDHARALFLDSFVRIQTVLARRSAVLACGGFDEELWVAEDHELFLRMALAGCKFDYTPAVLALYRYLADSLSRRHERMVNGELRVLQKHLDAMVARHPAVAHYALGRAYLSSGQREEAVREIRQALLRAPWRLRYWVWSLLAAGVPGSKGAVRALRALQASGARRGKGGGA